MPLEFVTPCEPLSTEEPVADKGPFASVQAHVGPQQGRLPESLATVGDMAHMLLLALLSRPENGRWGRGKGKRREGGGRRQGQNRMERGSGVRSKIAPLPGPQPRPRAGRRPGAERRRFAGASRAPRGLRDDSVCAPHRDNSDNALKVLQRRATRRGARAARVAPAAGRRWEGRSPRFACGSPRTAQALRARPRGPRQARPNPAGPQRRSGSCRHVLPPDLCAHLSHFQTR